MRIICAAVLSLGLISPAAADEPTLNDLPAILQKLRGCTETRGIFSGGTTCVIDEKDLWVSVSGTGSLTLFRYRRSGDTTYARGASVGALLRDFAAKLNEDQAASKAMLEALGPFLATQ